MDPSLTNCYSGCANFAKPRCPCRYPMVRERVEAGRLVLHGWHYVIEDGEVHVFDVKSGSFVPASNAVHSGTGPFDHTPVDDGRIFNEVDAAFAPIHAHHDPVLI